jgi:hypothetical protein
MKRRQRLAFSASPGRRSASGLSTARQVRVAALAIAFAASPSWPQVVVAFFEEGFTYALCATPARHALSTRMLPPLFSGTAQLSSSGPIGPFNLLTYAEVKNARQIAEVTQNRLMPPWPPGGHVSSPTTQVGNELGIVSNGWQERDEGAAVDLAPPPTWPGLAIGAPDLIVEMPAPYAFPPPADVYHHFVRKFRSRNGVACARRNFGPAARPITLLLSSTAQASPGAWMRRMLSLGFPA